MECNNNNCTGGSTPQMLLPVQLVRNGVRGLESARKQGVATGNQTCQSSDGETRRVEQILGSSTLAHHRRSHPGIII